MHLTNNTHRGDYKKTIYIILVVVSLLVSLLDILFDFSEVYFHSDLKFIALITFTITYIGIAYQAKTLDIPTVMTTIFIDLWIINSDVKEIFEQNGQSMPVDFDIMSIIFCLLAAAFSWYRYKHLPFNRS